MHIRPIGSCITNTTIATSALLTMHFLSFSECVSWCFHALWWLYGNFRDIKDTRKHRRIILVVFTLQSSFQAFTWCDNLQGHPWLMLFFFLQSCVKFLSASLDPFHCFQKPLWYIIHTIMDLFQGIIIRMKQPCRHSWLLEKINSTNRTNAFPGIGIDNH